MSWLEIACIALVGLGIFAGAILVAQRPTFWIALAGEIIQKMLPKIVAYVTKRMPEKEEEEMRREFRAGRGGEWLKKWHRRRRG